LWWRRTDEHLRALGLGASLLGPTISPLTLLGADLLGPNGGSETNDPSARCSQRRLSSSDTPAPPRAEELLAAPLPLSKGRGATTEAWEALAGALGATPADWGPPAGASEIRIPRWGSRPLVWRTATPLSSRVSSVAKIAVLSPGSSQSAEMPWGRIRDSGMKDSPVIPFTRTSSSSQVRSVLGPRCTRLMSFEPVNQRHRHALCCSDAIRCFRKSPTTCIDVRPPAAKLLILSSTSWNSGARDGSALHCFRTSLGPSLGKARQSLASALAFTQSSRQFSHLAPPREGCSPRLDPTSSGNSRRRGGP
jgi:hypothetical protein